MHWTNHKIYRCLSHQTLHRHHLFGILGISQWFSGLFNIRIRLVIKYEYFYYLSYVTN